jgi:hypothetical protein
MHHARSHVRSAKASHLIISRCCCCRLFSSQRKSSPLAWAIEGVLTPGESDLLACLAQPAAPACAGLLAWSRGAGAAAVRWADPHCTPASSRLLAAPFALLLDNPSAAQLRAVALLNVYGATTGCAIPRPTSSSLV